MTLWADLIQTCGQLFYSIISLVVFVYTFVCAQIRIILISPYLLIYRSQYFGLQILVSMSLIISPNFEH